MVVGERRSAFSRGRSHCISRCAGLAWDRNCLAGIGQGCNFPITSISSALVMSHFASMRASREPERLHLPPMEAQQAIASRADGTAPGNCPEFV